MRFFRWLQRLLVVVVPFGLLSRHKPRQEPEWHDYDQQALKPSKEAHKMTEPYRKSAISGTTIGLYRFNSQKHSPSPP